MKIRAFFLFLFIVNNIASYGQNEKLLSIEQQINDIDELEQKLKTVHPSLYRFCSLSQFDSTITSIKKNIKQPNTEKIFFELLSPIFLQIKDAHTWKQLSRREHSKMLIPLDFKIIEDQLFIYNNCSSKDELTVISRSTPYCKPTNRPLNLCYENDRRKRGKNATALQENAEQWIKQKAVL